MGYWKKILYYSIGALAIGFMVGYGTRKSIERQAAENTGKLIEGGARFIERLTRPDSIDLEIKINKLNIEYKKKNPHAKEV